MKCAAAGLRALRKEVEEEKGGRVKGETCVWGKAQGEEGGGGGGGAKGLGQM